MSAYEPYTTISDGVQDNFSIPFPYVRQAEVVVTVNNLPVEFTFLTASTIELADLPDDGDQVAIFRVTDEDDAAHTFAGGPVVSSDLNRNHRQHQYAIQELQEASYRNVRMPVGEPIDPLPSAAERRSGLLAFSATQGAVPYVMSQEEAAVLFQGDPGESATVVGLFAALPALSINTGIHVIITSGWDLKGRGSARYISVDEADVADLNDDLEHILWETSSNGRVFTLDLSQEITPLMAGARADKTTDDTLAFTSLQLALLDASPEDTTHYVGGPGVPADPADFYATNRKTGRIRVPAGDYVVSNNVFATPNHPRAAFVAFDYWGDGKMSSVLILKTNGAEAWFYNNTSSDPNKFQKLHWHDMGFRSDDYRYGNCVKMWSNGGPKQFRWTDCDFQYLQKFYSTEGTGNADLIKVTRCTGFFYGDVVTLNNDQSVQHDFIGSDFGTYGNFIKVKTLGGGNVNVVNGSLDFLYHEDFSPAAGNAMFNEDTGAAIGQGNCTFAFRDCRVEVEAYRRTAGAAPFGLVKTQAHPNVGIPRIIFDHVNFVNGKTYTINVAGVVTGEDYRRITAVSVYPRKYVEFRNCVLLKSFFYAVGGVRDEGSANAGGIIKFTNCFDGIPTELPTADALKSNLHQRVTYASTVGRVITEGMMDDTGGSSFIRHLLDADPRWRRQLGHEPASTKKLVSFKHINNGMPNAANAANDHYLVLPAGFEAIKLHVKKPAQGAITNAYQLHIKANDRSGAILWSSTLAQQKDLHEIVAEFQDLSAYHTLCLCASGVGTDFDAGGFATVEYI